MRFPRTLLALALLAGGARNGSAQNATVAGMAATASMGLAAGSPLAWEGRRNAAGLEPVRALRMAGGLEAASAADAALGDVDGMDDRISVPDVVALLSENDILIADFEGPGYDGWAVTGTALGSGPARGTLPGQQAVSGFLGQGLVNTFLGGDGATGTLTSPEFPIARPYINFLVGGGAHPGGEAVNLLVDGQVVRTATGADDERLSWWTWDVRDFLGRTVRLQIVDNLTGGWGHISADQIMMSAAPRLQEPGLVARWAFNEGAGAAAMESVSGVKTGITSHGNPTEWATGPNGSALRLDGYSTWTSKALPPAQQPAGALTVEAWVAVQSYPVANAGLVNQFTYPSSGWDLALDPYGRWYLAVSVNGKWVTCWASAPLPKGTWVHLAGTFQNGRGMAVYLNGQVVGTASPPAGDITPESAKPLYIGRSADSPYQNGIFAEGVVNGLISDVRVYKRALSGGEIAQTAGAVTKVPAADFSVPPTRFAGDPHRPAYHPQPEANWTNEPHGLVYWNGAWHMFFQKNPNGPYWAAMHWGHLVSRDLARWDEAPIALAPEPGYDEGGIWSGNAVVKDGALTAVYTAKGSGGVALAGSTDGVSFRRFAGNPVLFTPPGYEPFRDPYAWRQDGVWYMVVGSAVNGAGTALLFRSPDLVSWKYLRPILVADPAVSGTFWEMPGFVPVGDKWMFYVSTLGNGPARELYWLGTWQNEVFTPDPGYPKPMDAINHMLSPAISVGPDGRAILVGLNIESRSGQDAWRYGYIHGFTLPRVLTLGPDGALVQGVAPEVNALRGPVTHREGVAIPSGVMNLTGVSGDQLEIQAEFARGTAREFGLRVRCSPDGAEQTLITYDAAAQVIKVAGQSAPFTVPAGQTLKLRVFLDHSMLEVFANGRSICAWRVYPGRADSLHVGLYAAGGDASLVSMDTWPMKATWEPALN